MKIRAAPTVLTRKPIQNPEMFNPFENANQQPSGSEIKKRVRI
jgi:hypothetical protein